MGTSLHISYENIATPTDKSMPYAKGQADSKETNYVLFIYPLSNYQALHLTSAATKKVDDDWIQGQQSRLFQNGNKFGVHEFDVTNQQSLLKHSFSDIDSTIGDITKLGVQDAKQFNFEFPVRHIEATCRLLRCFQNVLMNC